MAKPQTKNLRWWIGGMLFASTVINYLDRQTLSTLAPYLKQDYNWSNSDYALLVIFFRVAYSFGQTIFGRWMDRIGTRRGLTLSVTWYSIASILTSLASGWWSFAAFRFLLGVGESANWPAATKAVAEWFPKRERGWATALFDSGSSIGGAIAPLLIVPIYLRWGWRPAFVIPGLLGFFWLIAWRKIYHPPDTHPRISAEERAMLREDREESGSTGAAGRPGCLGLLLLPQTWGVIIARSFTDPVWFFIADWFAIYLVSRGFKVEETLLAFWIPFVAADLGNFFGGGASSWLIQRGWSVERARKAIVIFGAIGMTLLIPTVYTSNLFAIAGLFAISTFAYAAFSTMAIVLATDLYQNEAVATVSGMSGTGAGIGTILSTILIGKIADKYSFEPILIAASLIPMIGAIMVMFLVRNSAASGKGILRRI
ncbi:MAG: MFS transporter [Blastocatellia bacterium]|nr:MFS transporter [Blastocatellia bacterium]